MRYVVDRFDVEAVDVVEEVPMGLPVGDALEAIAMKKALAASVVHPRQWCLGADTVVVLGGMMLHKPRTATEARENLEAISGSSFQVVTGLALARRHQRVDVEQAFSTVTVEQLDAVIDDYLEAGHWEGKAGGISVQEPMLGKRMHVSKGEWSNVVGLPLGALHELLIRNSISCKHPPSEQDLQDHNPFVEL